MPIPNFTSIIYGDGLRFNTETYSLEIDLENMTGIVDEFVFFKIIGQDEVYKMSTMDNITYSANVPMERFSLTNYSIFVICAYNPDGIAITSGYLSVVNDTVSCIVKEGFGIDPVDWEDVGDIHEFLNSLDGEYITLEKKIVSNYFAEPLDNEVDMKDDVYMMFIFTNIYGMTSTGVTYLGLFEREPDMEGISYNYRPNLFGYRLNIDSSLTFIGIDVMLKYVDGLSVVEETIAMNTTIVDSDDYVLEVYWDKSDILITATISKFIDGILTIIEKKYLELEDMPSLNMDMFGVANEINPALLPYPTIQFNVKNFLLNVGKEKEEHPKVVAKTSIKTNYTPSDAQILVQFYDFETGEIVESPNDIEVLILDKDELVIDTLDGILRDDGWYEAYFDTLNVDRDTYIVRVIAEIYGKTYVIEELLSVQ